MPSHGDQHHPAPVIYSALTTRRSSYPKWVFLKSPSIPVLMKHINLSDNAYRTLLSLQHAVIVPPILNNVVDCLGLLLWHVPFCVQLEDAIVWSPICFMLLAFQHIRHTYLTRTIELQYVHWPL